MARVGRVSYAVLEMDGDRDRKEYRGSAARSLYRMGEACRQLQMIFSIGVSIDMPFHFDLNVNSAQAFLIRVHDTCDELLVRTDIVATGIMGSNYRCHKSLRQYLQP